MIELEGEVNIVELTPRRSRGDYLTIFTEPEENNCFSIIAQVIIGATAFSFIITSCEVIIHTVARYDAILDQSKRALLYNHLSNYTNFR